MAKAKSKIEIRNKKASYEYEFLENYTAGIVLTGTEIKSIRAGKASLVDSWCYFSGGELYVKNMHIAEYWWGTFNRHDPKRDRKLLLTRKELRKPRPRRQGKGPDHRHPPPLHLRDRLRQARHRPRPRQKGIRQARVHQGKGPPPLLSRLSQQAHRPYISIPPKILPTCGGFPPFSGAKVFGGILMYGRL